MQRSPAAPSVRASLACVLALPSLTSAYTTSNAAIGAGASAAAGEIAFERHVLSREFFGEGATFGDFDRDGHQDVVSGPYWYRGPDFAQRAELWTPKAFDPKGYSNSFFDFVRDFDGDGWPDVLVVGFPGADASWFENPRGAAGPWKRHLAFPTVDNESPWFADLTGDGAPELVFHTGGKLGWAAPDASDPRAPWKFHALSDDRGYERFTHGLGVGDVDGDARADVLTKDGWWQQPRSLAGDPPWPFHPYRFAERGGAQMLVMDVDDDGDSDVVSSLAAHDFGLSWFEQKRTPSGIDFVAHPILGETPADNPQGVCFAELHALAACDVDGDKRLDVVTGKRFWSHGQRGDPEAGNPAVLYWFQLARGPRGVEWIPHRIDDDSGVGTQVVAGDVDGDGRADVVVGNKQGTFVFLQRRANSKPAPAKPNLDFEDGTLRGWTAEGDAFQGQPIYGDTCAGRGREPSKHAGKYWIGGYEKKGDGATGTLTSDAFACTAPYASFLVGGGAGSGERVELWDDGAAKPFFTTNAANFESMQRVVVDLRAHAGRSIRVKLVDSGTGGWGHLNFDDFQFHAEKPQFERDAAIPLILIADPPKAAGLSPADAARAMTVPEGFRVDVIAAEPDLQQPVAMAIDPKGRIWIAEAFSYPEKRAAGDGRDVIRVLEDKDHDGTFETRTTFAEHLNLVSGLEVGFGGVWIGQAPELLFVPDRDDDLVPDGPAEILLDGFGYEDTHETLNTFTWGPDGWLYGCHGVFTHSRVGKPGTPDAQRVPLDAGVWRFHPTRREFEVFAWGTSNPWGLDFDARGQAFVTACVIPHLYHMIQGGRYVRQGGAHFDACAYDDIPTIADHRHYAGSDPHGGNGRSDALGGGHAHCGAMIYRGGAFPASYDGALFMGNIHGNRINVDRLEPKDSSFVGRHDKDFLLANDAWFRAINMEYGPDGSVYLIDWYDPQACHLTDAKRWDRTNGRLYRVSYGAAKPRAVDLRAMTSAQLVEIQLDPNEWFARAAQLVLAERGADGAVRATLEDRLRSNAATPVRLRALWTLAASGNLTDDVLLVALSDTDDAVVAWAIQLACERDVSAIPRAWGSISARARSSDSPMVRLYLASALQRVPIQLAAPAIDALVRATRSDDDVTLQRVLWFAYERLAAHDAALALDAAPRANALQRGWMLRRLAADAPTRESLLARASMNSSPLTASEVMEALRLAIGDESRLPLPRAWPAFHELVAKTGDAKLADAAMSLATIFGDARAFPKLRARLVDPKASDDARRGALDTLARGGDAESLPAILALLDTPALRIDAIRGLANYDDARVAPAQTTRWAAFARPERDEALTTLAGRPDSAVALLEEVRAGRIARTDVSAYALRTLENLRDERVAQLLAATIGVVRRTSDQKLARIAELKRALEPQAVAAVDRVHGREVFATSCSRCHTVFGSGGTLAPDLTGSNRRDLEYLLSNMVDPSAVIPVDYQVTMIWTKDERLVTGIVKKRTQSSIVLATETGSIFVDKDDVEEEKLSPVSTMPDGLLDALKPKEIVDLVAYLQGDAQAVRRGTRENAGTLFDGRTLAGWTGDANVWSVADGEIVGSTSGLDHNTFLASDLELGDFRLVLDVRLVKNEGNSGIQFRSVSRPDGEMIGCQADVGPGWWGKLYEENGRAILWDRSGEAAVVADGWNRYEIVAVGSRVLTAINGVACVDLDDAQIARSGVLALQVHSGGATEVRFKNLALEIDPEPVLKTLKR